MVSAIASEVGNALVDLSTYNVVLGSADAIQPDELTDRVASLLGEGGYCVCFGSARSLRAAGKDIFQERETAALLLESVFRGAMRKIAFDEFAVVQAPMTIGKMDVDGFNLNQNFSHDGNITSRAFMTTKCIHFDAATPFVANIYGLNENVGGGLPLICDTRRFCAENAVDPKEIVEAIPNNYNVAISDRFYDRLLDGYSVALDVDLEADMICIMLRNEVENGVAHGATDPYKIDPAKPCVRPIRHLEYQFSDEGHYQTWYKHYGIDMVDATDYGGENLALAYHHPPSRAFEQIVVVR